MIIRILVIVGMLVMLLIGCTSGPTPIEQYKTEQDAIDRYIETEKIRGTLIQFNLSDDKRLLLAEYKRYAYFVGELIETEEGFAAVKLTPTLDIGNTDGVILDCKTWDGSQHTMSLFKEKQNNTPTYIEELELYVSIEEKSPDSERSTIGHDLVQSYEVM
ncbi:hypothetical protein ABES58_13635 [Paenibacillus lautus]|uniref:hypothetical protein n=1 Tax=Paenibacillus lautus TaxID=1401 RepID=UPI003D27652C